MLCVVDCSDVQPSIEQHQYPSSSLSNKQRRHRLHHEDIPSASIQPHSTTLDIHLVAATRGHIAVSLQGGRLLAVFDAVPSQQQLSNDARRELHSFLRVPPIAATEPFPGLLALPTAGSPIVYMCFLTPHTDELSVSPTRFLTVQADGSFLLWQYAAAEAEWSFISRGVLPLVHQQPDRCVVSAVYCSSHHALLWCERYKGRTLVYRAELPALTAEHVGEVTEVESVAIIPLTLPAEVKVELLTTQHGVLIRASQSTACHYYHLTSLQLVRLPPPTTSSASSSTVASCHYHTHAVSAQTLCWTCDGTLYQLQETADSPSPHNLLSAPLAKWQFNVQLSPSADDNDTSEDDDRLFPLPATALFFAFHQTLCVVRPFASQHKGGRGKAVSLFSFFTWPGGVFIDRCYSSLPSLHVVPLMPATGLSGSGTLLFTAHELHCVVPPSAASLLAHLTAASPHTDHLKRIEEDGGLLPSDTFASLSFSPSTFPPAMHHLLSLPSSLPASASTSPLPPMHRSLSSPSPSLLIPSLPYPYLSHIGSQLATSYGASMSAQREQSLIDRWLGCVTAGSAADIVPQHITSHQRQQQQQEAELRGEDAAVSVETRCIGLSKQVMLREAAACLQAPALPAAVTLLPSLVHYQYGHKYDCEQEAAVKEELEEWLARMEQQKADDRQLQRTNSKAADTSATIDKKDDYRTPLNESLLPLLYTLRASTEQIDAAPADSSTSHAADLSALPVSLALPPLVSLSTQLSRAMSNRSSSSSLSSSTSRHPSFDSSLSTLAMSQPGATFTYLRSLLGLDALLPLSECPHPTGVHSNLLLLNESIRLKQELGVWGLDVPINSASLQRGAGMPCFELMCRLYDSVQPDTLSAFVHIMQREAAGEPVDHIEVSGVEKWQRTVAGRAVGRYCERALACLPLLLANGALVDEVVASTELVVLEQRVAARCWLLQDSGRLTDAVLLCLDIARRVHTASAGGAAAAQQLEEAAIALAYQVSPECVAGGAPSSNELVAAEAEDSLDALRAALYHRITAYLFDRALAGDGGNSAGLAEGETVVEEENGNAVYDEDERSVVVQESVLASLDGRVRSLRPPHFSAQHFGLLMQQTLRHEGDDEEENEEEDEDEEADEGDEEDEETEHETEQEDD